MNFEIRNNGYTTPARRQRCGNCWAYAAMAMLEANYVKASRGQYEPYAIFKSRVSTKTVFMDKNGKTMRVKVVSKYNDGRRAQTSYYSFQI